MLKIIRDYTRALDLLDNYDHKEVSKPKGTTSYENKIEYKNCIEIIKQMKLNEKSSLFALEREDRFRIYNK